MPIGRDRKELTTKLSESPVGVKSRADELTRLISDQRKQIDELVGIVKALVNRLDVVDNVVTDVEEHLEKLAQYVTS